MKRKAHPTRIGLFMLGAVVLLVAAVVLVSGGALFSSRERAVAYFDGSVYGLQLGAPVVFRGVRLGSVVGIGVVYQGQPGRYAIPVEIEIDRERIAAANGTPAPLGVSDLVTQGLSAQLATQSLLTGLLYVDLDLRATAAAARPSAAAGRLPEIPTVATPIQALQQQLQSLNLPQIVADLGAVAAGARQLVGHPRLQHTLDELAASSTELRKLLARADQRLGPLADALQGTLSATRQTAEQWGGAVDRVGSAVDRVGRAADRVGETLARVDGVASAAQPAMADVQRAAAELARSAQALRQAATDEAGVLPQVERAAQDIARASRAVRDLADLLERQPEALLRGRSANP